MKKKIVEAANTLYLKLGIGVLIFSGIGLLLFHKSNGLLASLSLGVTWIGLLFVIDYLMAKRFHVHYLPTKKEDIPTFLLFSLFSVVFCFILEIGCLYTTRLWHYPSIPFYIYVWGAPFFYVFYTLVLFELYEFIKHYLQHHRKSIKVSKDTYRLIMKMELVLGILATFLWARFSWMNVSKFKVPFWDVSLDSAISVPWWFAFALLFSMFFCFEYIAYIRGRDTFTRDVLKGDIRPVVAIIGANVIAILLMEMVNAPFQIWVYGNWFMQDVKFYSLPVWVLLLWPGQFFAFLALFSAFIGKKRAEIW